jgi:DNA-binding PadR family transcriptional regulator
MNFKGTLPTLILEALAHEPAHGYRIAQQIKERSQGVLDFKEGTLYPALHKLENEGLVESYEDIEKEEGRAAITASRGPGVACWPRIAPNGGSFRAQFPRFWGRRKR